MANLARFLLTLHLVHAVDSVPPLASKLVPGRSSWGAGVGLQFQESRLVEHCSQSADRHRIAFMGWYEIGLPE